MFRATYFVTVMCDAPVVGDTFQEAVETAKKKACKDLVKVRPGVEVCDWQVQVSSVTDMNVNGEM